MVKFLNFTLANKTMDDTTAGMYIDPPTQFSAKGFN